MDSQTVLLFTRNGLGDAPADLQGKLAQKFLTLINESGMLPAKILFYTDGVTEAMSPDKEEFSDQRLQETIRAARDLDTGQVDLVIMVSEFGLAKNVDFAENYPGIDVILSADMHEETRDPVTTSNGTIISATMLMILISGLTAGPAVSL